MNHRLEDEHRVETPGPITCWLTDLKTTRRADRLHELEKYADATPDLMSAVIDEAGKLAAEVIQPTNQAGDRQGCQYDPETRSVTTPDGFKEAYRKFVEGGWTALDAPLEFGGQGLPHTLTRRTGYHQGHFPVRGAQVPARFGRT